MLRAHAHVAGLCTRYDEGGHGKRSSGGKGSGDMDDNEDE